MYVKLNSDLFLGSNELNRLVKSLDEDGFRRLLLQEAVSFGFINNSKAGGFDNFKVAQGTNVGSIKHNEGIAINNSGQIIYRLATDNIVVTNDNQWYWVKVSHNYSSKETGLVSIDRNGNLTGTGTEFTKVLRGRPNNPVKITFSGASLNTLEYEVVEVISDTSAVVAGDFLAESNLYLVVVGAFTPNITPPVDSKQIYQYDDCIFTLILETILNTPPSLIDDEEFVVARVKRNGAAITIQDKRTAIFRTKSDFELNQDLSDSNNPLIGVEAVKFNHPSTPRDRNVVYLAWGFRSSNWTFDSSTNRVTMIGGQGGKYKDTGDFVDGDFDGWRLYTKNGKYKIIQQSSVTALQINLILDSLDPDDFNTDLVQELRVVPNAEQIEIIAQTPVVTKLPEQKFLFPINAGEVRIELIVYNDPSCQYTIKYRYKNFKQYSQETLIPNDTDNGYLVEADFDSAGTQTASNRQTYSNGLITLIQTPSAYVNRIAAIETGDLFGVEYLTIDTSTIPVMDFIVGTRKRHVVVTNDDDLNASDSDFGTTYNFTANGFINLRSDTPSTLRNGNSFLLQIRGDYNFNGFGLRIVQDYVNVGNPGIDLYGFTQDDLDSATLDNLLFLCTWDGTRWFAEKITKSITSSTIRSLNGTWHTIALINGWGANGGSTIQWRYNSTGRVELRGRLLSSGATSGIFASPGSVPNPMDAIGVNTYRIPIVDFSNDVISFVVIGFNGQLSIPTYVVLTTYELNGVSYLSSY